MSTAIKEVWAVLVLCFPVYVGGSGIQGRKIKGKQGL